MPGRRATMKLIQKILIVSALALFQGALGQRIAIPYEIATWQGFKPAAISYTFDDNCPNQLATAVPLFDKQGFKVTLFTVINWAPNWVGLRTAAANGHEIASHTVTHPNLDSINETRQTVEFHDSKNRIDSNIVDSKCVTIAYPFCSCSNSKLCSEFYIAARSCDGYDVPSTPADFMHISSINCGAEGPGKTATDLNTKVESAIQQNGWCVFLFHGIDNDQAYSPMPSEQLGTHLKYVYAKRANYWVATFGNVVRYIKERNAVILNVKSETPTRISLQLTDTLNNEIYNYPVSIRRPIPKGWKGASVMQGDEKRSVFLVKKDKAAYIQFDAIPNAGTIVINKQKTALAEMMD